MNLPAYFGLGVTRAGALRIVQLLSEVAPHCEECAALLSDIERQLSIFNRNPHPTSIKASQGGCINCQKTP